MAARPHGSNATSREWPVGPNEPYWQTNACFSPTPSRWDIQFQPEGPSFGSHDGNPLYSSSISSNSRGSRSWVRGNYLSNHPYSISMVLGHTSVVHLRSLQPSSGLLQQFKKSEWKSMKIHQGEVIQMTILLFCRL